jgi:hypothetical protein
MRKLIAFAAVVAVALGAPAAIGAGQGKKKYFGGFESSGALSFVVKKTEGGKRVFNFKWEDFPLDCKGTPETSSSNLSFSVKVENKKFETRAVDNQQDPGALLKLKGQLVGKSAANGSMSIEGKDVPVDSGGKKSCESGKVGWGASTTL